MNVVLRKILRPQKLFFVYFLSIFVFLGYSNGLFAQENTDSQKTILVTGGCGFIGSNFVRHMFRAHPTYKLIVLDALTYAGSLKNIPAYIANSDRFEFVKGNICDAPLVEELMSRADWVVHFAAESHVAKSIENDLAFFNTNVLGTRTLLQALLHHRKNVQRFIHISSSEVYGTARYLPMDESHPLDPRSPYAASKAAGDRTVYSYWCTYDLPVVIIRPFNNYGPNQHPEKVIPRFIQQALQGIALTVHGNGHQARDWLYVVDHCKALDAVLHSPDFSKLCGQEVNLGTERAVSLLDIAAMILKRFNLPEDFLTLEFERPGQVMCHNGSYQKALHLLGWAPSVSFEKGLNETIDWYLSNPWFLSSKTNSSMEEKKCLAGI